MEILMLYTSYPSRYSYLREQDHTENLDLECGTFFPNRYMTCIFSKDNFVKYLRTHLVSLCNKMTIGGLYRFVMFMFVFSFFGQFMFLAAR